ncbi:MAG: adenylate/guanylate cyclase domain-containing protein [Verrucomicrobiota bacterium]
MKFLKRRRVLVFSAITAVLTGTALLPQFEYFKFFYSIDQSFLSFRYFIRGFEDSAKDRAPIVIVGVDDASLYSVLSGEVSEEDLAANPEVSNLNSSWPWNRSVHGFLAERLFDAGARVVAFDFIFPTPNEGDWQFYEVIEANIGRLIISYNYVPVESELGEIRMVESLPYEDLLPIEGEEELLGFVNIERDSDGVLRRAKLRTNLYAENQRFILDPALRANVLNRAKRSPPSFSLGTQAAILSDPAVREEVPPLFQSPLVNYGGLDYFPTVSYLDVLLEDRFDAQKSLFQDAIVLVGPFSDFFKDIYATPIGDLFGVEYHAHITRSLLNRSFFTELRGPARLAALVFFAFALLIGTLKFRGALQKAGWMVALIVVYLVLSQLAFNHLHLVVPIVPALWILLGTGFTFIIYDFALSQYDRLKLKGYLSRYVSPEVASVLSDESSELETILTGVSRPVAVLFSDIRGFTTLSEHYAPVKLVAHLNDYFESMVGCIHKHNGTLNKYIGDAILAVWGGLFSKGAENDCLHAVSSALDMEQQMIELNRNWSNDPDKLPFKIGIGISHGNAFVGNMGHSNRKEFAVMGDVVNLGSRLEGATKQYGCSILVSEEVYQLCKNKVRFRDVDIIRVKGKSKGVHTYEPINFVSDPEPSWLDQWNQSLTKYRERDFKTAQTHFSRLKESVPALVQSATLYEERCKLLITMPPPENWDFVYVMETK